MVKERLGRLLPLMSRELEVLTLGSKIQKEVASSMSKSQRDFFLREQLRSIQRELGEGEDNVEITQLRERLAAAGLPEEPRREAERELERLAVIPPVSPEYGLIRTYLDWMVSLPWNLLTGGDIDVARARAVLDADHYDLDKVKDRILEHLAVEKLRRERLGASASSPPESAGEMTPADEAACRWVACATKPRFAATAARTSARCPAASSRASAAPRRAIPYSC